jgi:hypothetical protein
MHELVGTDYFWYCTDSDGQIAVMLTAGIAPIPISVLAGISRNNNLRKSLLGMPKIGSYLIEVRDVFVKNSSGVYALKHISQKPIPDNEVAQDLYSDFFNHASQGIYGFDWSDIHRIEKWQSNKYELIARPTTPLLVSDLPNDLQSVLSATKLHGVRFSESKAIDVTAYLKCV